MQRPRGVFSSALYLPPPAAYMAGMNARPILRAGHPILAQTARPVENPRAPEMADLVAVMRASCGVNDLRVKDYYGEEWRVSRGSGEPTRCAAANEPRSAPDSPR